jgi:hypothetical protein
LAGPKRSRIVPFLIVSPNQITAARTVEIEGVEEGIVRGDPNLKEWFIETSDGKRHQLRISGASPFEDARQTLNFLLPNLDGFLHSRGIKNPFVHSLLVFPDGYSLEGIRDAAIGPHSRAAISLVKAADVPEAALFTTQEQRLDPAIFLEWLKLVVGSAGGSTFKDTWLDRPGAQPAEAPNGPLRPREQAAQTPLEIPREQDSNDWVIDAPPGEPPLIDLGDETLLEQEKRYRSKQQTTPARKPKRNKKAVVFTIALALVFVAAGLWLVYEFRRPVTLPPYLQESASSPPPETTPVAPAEETQPSPNPAASADSGQPEPPSEKRTAENPVKQEAAAAKERPATSAESKRTPSQTAAKQPETPVPGPENPPVRRSAPTGTYETIRPTLALKQADASAPIADRIAAGTRLNVVGSDGDWLIVHSRAKNATVYVNRADAVPISDRTAGKSGANIELKWKEIELQIQEAILKRGVSGITVSFIGDTAFLKGTVQTEQQSRAAELAARTIPEVSHIHNGIWVRP